LKWSLLGLKQDTLTYTSPQRLYRGVNILTLGIAEMVNGYSSPYWITFRQAQKHGGYIKRGERATYIVFSDKKVREIEKEDGTKEQKVYHFVKSFPVFNWDQTEGVPKKEAGLALDPDRDLIEVCDSLIAKMPNPPAYREGGSSAYYMPANQVLSHLPDRKPLVCGRVPILVHLFSLQKPDLSSSCLENTRLDQTLHRYVFSFG
jgi:antirestriction protein ArdC